MAGDLPEQIVGDARAWIPQLQRAGLSANEALSQLRAAGAGMRRETFLRAWGEVAADMASRGANLARDLTAPSLRGEMPGWHAGRPGQIGYTGRIVLRDRATNTLTTKEAMVFSETPLSPADAVDRMIAVFQEGAQTGTANDVVVTAYFVQDYEMLGPR